MPLATLYISYVLASAMVPARHSIFSFSSYLQLHIFKWAFVPGRRAMNSLPAAILNVTCNADKHSNELAVGGKSDKPKTEIKRENIL